MRIVQILETLDVGGLETMALQLASAQRRAGDQAAVYTVFEPGPMAAAAEVPVTAFCKPKGFDSDTVWKMARRLREDGAEVVHTHNASIHHYGALAGRLAGAAVVNTRHGVSLHSSPRQNVWFRLALPLTDASVFVSEHARRNYESKGLAPPAKSAVIHNGIDLGPFLKKAASPGAALPRIRFGTIGRLVKAKAHGDLIEAFEIANLGAAELHIWGYGELEAQVEERVARSRRVFFHGAAKRPAEVLSGLDVFVLSSISEGLPLVVLEAMAAGLPVVATRAGGTEEAAPHAWLAEPGNPESLAAAMRKAAESDLPAVGRAARAWAGQRFGIEAMRRQYDALYRRLLDG